MKANPDTIAIIDFLKRGAEMADKAVGVPIAKETFEDALGRTIVIYRLEDDVRLLKIACP